MLFILVFVGCEGDSYYNIAAQHPTSGNVLHHFSQEHDNYCGCACAQMHLFYAGLTLVPQDVIMDQADTWPADDLIGLSEYVDWFNFNTEQWMAGYGVPVIAGDNSADREQLASEIQTMTMFGVTPMFVFGGNHGIIVGGFSHDDSYEVSHIIVFDPAVPDTAREKAIMMWLDDFHQRVTSIHDPSENRWVYPFVAQWDLMPVNSPELPDSPDSMVFSIDLCSYVLDDPEGLDLMPDYKRFPPPPIYPFADGRGTGVSEPAETYEDTVRCHAHTALGEWIANSPMEAAERFGEWLSYGIHIGEVTPTSKEHWDPPEDYAKPAGPALYM